MGNSDKPTSRNVLALEKSPQSPFDRYQLEQAFSPLLENPSLQVCEVFSGNINTIIKVKIRFIGAHSAPYVSKDLGVVHNRPAGFLGGVLLLH